MTKKENNDILKKIELIKEELNKMDQLLMDDSKHIKIKEYREKIKELYVLKKLRDAYKPRKRGI